MTRRDCRWRIVPRLARAGIGKIGMQRSLASARTLVVDGRRDANRSRQRMATAFTPSGSALHPAPRRGPARPPVSRSGAVEGGLVWRVAAPRPMVSGPRPRVAPGHRAGTAESRLSQRLAQNEESISQNQKPVGSCGLGTSKKSSRRPAAQAARPVPRGLDEWTVRAKTAWPRGSSGLPNPILATLTGHVTETGAPVVPGETGSRPSPRGRTPSMAEELLDARGLYHSPGTRNGASIPRHVKGGGAQ
jgi:hypothetical protein